MKQYIQTLFSFLVISLCLMSCEGYRSAIGTVYDKYTKMPIENVKCTVLETDQVYYSDSIGKYSVRGKFGPLIPKPDIEVEFSKEGYNTITIINPNSVYLENLQVLNTFKQDVEYCGLDNNSKLNNYEAVFLNNYIENRNDFDFNNKKILFVTGSGGGKISSKKEYFNNVKEWREKHGGKVQTSLETLSVEESKLYEYDAIVLYWVKIFTPKLKKEVLERSKS